MGRAIYLRLYSVHASRAKETALQAVTLLARSHTPDLVDAFLDFSRPLDRYPAAPTPVGAPVPVMGPGAGAAAHL